jgi:HEAT repeat protein
MQGPIHNLAALAVCSCLLLASGCAETAERASGSWARLWGKKTDEEVLNIKTPQDHLKELQELSKTGKKKTPEEQQRITAELANEIKHESDPLMRRQILRTLVAYPTPLSSSLLVAGLGDSDADVRRVACECLGKRGGKEAVQELSRVSTSDTETDVRIAAVRALGQTADASALPPLAEALADPNPAMQFRAQESLRAVSGHDFGNDVHAWREYAKSGKSDAPEPSLVERFRRTFF